MQNESLLLFSNLKEGTFYLLYRTNEQLNSYFLCACIYTFIIYYIYIIYNKNFLLSFLTQTVQLFVRSD